MHEKHRIDLYLVEKNYCETRSQAQQMVDFSLVKINGNLVVKASEKISDNDAIEVLPWKYVSRAGYKLEYAIKEFKIDLTEKVVLDLGASTGGFTDCCLQHKAKLVYALDVGKDQLANKLRNNPKVINLEKTNLKDINKINFPHQIDIVVCDVSFISLKHVFANLTNFYTKDLIMIFLIKPQFELDKKILNATKGIIKNPKHHQQAIEKVVDYAKKSHLELIKLTKSPLLGKKGENQEFLGYFQWKE